jgi:hypothetical protein
MNTTNEDQIRILPLRQIYYNFTRPDACLHRVHFASSQWKFAA